MKKLYPTVIWDRRADGKKLYITFDDGPTPGVTEKVLDLLDEFNAKATFFCLGRNAERHPDLFEEIKKRGHTVGNHTYSHLKGWNTDDETYYDDTELADHIIGSRLFRPPYGRIKKSQIKILQAKYKIILWEIMSHDYEPRLSEKICLKAVLRFSREGSILVFHDSLKASGKVLYVLPKLMAKFAEKGFTFEAIPEN
ncbi:MAG: polysaccharide deacetylase family protein [Bacteroidales bacterium]|nr:polysaccharide deacetylase family protein [Bacteroidales bacterium]